MARGNRRLKLVGKDTVPNPPNLLRARQIMPLMLVSGAETVVMVSEEGFVYTLGGDGWIAFKMVEEAFDDSTV